MIYSFDEIKTTVNECILPKKILEDNFFNIGTRGFYENPFTEVFAYIISEKSNYQHRIKFTKTFLESLNNLPNEVIESFIPEINVITQHATIKGNFIDLLIYNSKYILVFENKIKHWLANPIEDYESDIKYRYPHLTPYFFVLSYNSVDTPNPWINIVIGDSFSSIKRSISVENKGKWDFYVEDFLNHYILSKSQSMTNDEFEFYAKNFSKIVEANNQVNQFIIEVVSKVITSYPSGTIKRVTHQSWGENEITKVIRLFPLNSNDNIVIIFKNDGKFSINIYYCQNHLPKLIEFIGDKNYRNWKEGSDSCFTRLDGKEFNTIEELIEECKNQLNIMIKYYG